MNRNYALAVLTALTLALGACGKKEEAPKVESIPDPTPAPAPATPPAAEGVTAGSIAVGNAVGADKKVTQAGDSFGKKDTIYVSIDTTGTGTAKLRAKWSYKKNGQEVPVKDDSETISPSGPATSELHVSKPDGWPAGDYQVEVFLDEKPVGTKTFTVK